MAKIVVKKRHTIRKSQVARLKQRLTEEIGESAALFPFDRVEVVETDTDISIFLLDKKPLLFEFGEDVFPTLRGAIERPFPERRIVVDAGAVRFMVNGADVMRPGIVSVTDDVIANAPVIIAEERHQKPLAVAIALYNAEEIRGMEKGKAARNIHYIGDDIWTLEL